MKLESLLSESLKKKYIAIGGAGAVLTVLSFLVKPVAPFMPLIAAGVGAGAVYMISKEIKIEIKKFRESVKNSTQKIIEETTPKISGEPDELEEIKNFKRQLNDISKKFEAMLAEMDYRQKLHQSDISALASLFQRANSSRDPGEKYNDIISIAMNYCNFKDYYLFLKDPDEDVLIRRNPKKGEKAVFEEIPFYNDQYLPFLKTLESGTPEYIMKIKTDPLLNKKIKDWAEYNFIRMLYCVPLFLNEIPWGMIMFSLDEREELDTGQNLVINAAANLIGNLQREEIELLDMNRRFHQQEAESLVYQSLIDSKNISELCSNFFLSLKEYVPLEWGGISIEDYVKDAYKMFTFTPEDGEKGLKTLSIPALDSGIAWVRENQKTWIEEDLKLNKYFLEDEILSLEGLASRIITPLYSHDKFVGAISVSVGEAGVYNHIHKALMEKSAAIMGPVVEVLLAQENLDHRIEEMKTTNSNLKNFYDTMGHELRHSLDILHRIAYTVKKESERLSAGQVKKTFDFVTGRIQDLYKSLEDVLDYSRARSGKMEFHPRDFFLPELNDVMWEFEEKSEKRGVKLKWDVSPDIPEIIGDLDKIRGILRELIGNALKFSNDRGQITVRATLIPSSWLADKPETFFPKDMKDKIDVSVDQLLFTVTDTGAGIPEEKKGNLFKSALEAPEKYSGDLKKGLGLGLPLVKKLVEIHKGRIWYSTKENKGTRFSFNIPQYGKDRTDLVGYIEDRIQKAREDLLCLSIISISLKNIKLLKERFESQEIFNLINESEQTARKVLRDPLDVVRRHYNRETILVLCRADIKQSKAIIGRLQEVLGNVKSFIPDDLIDFEYFSITYPDQSLNAESLMSGIDKHLMKFAVERSDDE